MTAAVSLKVKDYDFLSFVFYQKEANMAACFLNLIMLCPDNESVTIYLCVVVFSFAVIALSDQFAWLNDAHVYEEDDL